MKRVKEIRKSQGQQGSILIFTVIILTSMLLLAVPFLFQLTNENQLTHKTFKSTLAISMAEAGVERAIWELNYGDISSWTGDSSLRTLTISDFQISGGEVMGDIEIKITDPDGLNPVIEATGKVELTETSELVARTTMVVLHEAPPPPLFNYAAFASEEINIESNAMIDSYDSRLGDYGGSNIGSEGNVGTNSSVYGCIDIASNADIYGNVLSGPESDPNTDIILRGSAEVHGERMSLTEPRELPSIAPPEGLTFMGDYYLDGNSTDIINQSGEYSSLRLISNATVTITEDVTLYITGDFSMRSNSQIVIPDGVNVTIYLGGTFVQESNTQINNLSRDPTSLIILGTDSFNGEMTWNSNSQFWGGVYTPKATVYFDSNSDFYGAISAKRFDSIASNAQIHYDKALTDLSIDVDGGEIFYAVKSWQEKVVTQ